MPAGMWTQGFRKIYYAHMGHASLRQMTEHILLKLKPSPFEGQKILNGLNWTVGHSIPTSNLNLAGFSTGST
jgi:hypothetical protein